MRKQRLYIDTSVFGGFYDEEFSKVYDSISAINLKNGYTL